MKREALPFIAVLGILSSPLLATNWEIATVDGGDVGYYSSLALDADGRPCIAYTTSGNVAPKAVLKYASLVGSAWVSQDIQAGRCFNPSLALDQAAMPCVAYQKHGQLSFIRQASGGVWHNEIAATSQSASYDTVGNHPSLAISVDGTVNISHFQWNAGDLLYTRLDAGEWTTSPVDTVGWVGSWNSIALDEDGNPCISSHNNTDLTVRYSHYDGTSWTTQTLPGRGYGTSLKMSSAGFPYISYWDCWSNRLLCAHYSGSCWIVEVVADVTASNTYTSLALDRQGNPHVAYWDIENQQLCHAYRGTSGWITEFIDAAYGYQSMQIDSRGNIHISYYDRTSGDLKYAYGAIPEPTGLSALMVAVARMILWVRRTNSTRSSAAES